MMDNLLETKLEGSDGSDGTMIHLEGIFPTTVGESRVNQINKSMCTWKDEILVN